MFACLFTNIPSEWEKVMTWSIATLCGKGLQASLGKLCLGACIYHLWQQRNALVHSSNLRTEETLIKHLKLFSRLCLIRTFFLNKKTLTNGAVAFVL
jgi:hypothetical protein